MISSNKIRIDRIASIFLAALCFLRGACFFSFTFGILKAPFSSKVVKTFISSFVAIIAQKKSDASYNLDFQDVNFGQLAKMKI
jgi:hypothetical protein